MPCRCEHFIGEHDNPFIFGDSKCGFPGCDCAGYMERFITLEEWDWCWNRNWRFLYFWSQVAIAALLSEMKPLRDSVTHSNRRAEEAGAVNIMEKRRAALACWLPPDFIERLYAAARAVVITAPNGGEDHQRAVAKLNTLIPARA